MDRTQRWGNQAEQRQERERYRKLPQHAHIPLRVLRCADCWQESVRLCPWMTEADVAVLRRVWAAHRSRYIARWGDFCRPWGRLPVPHNHAENRPGAQRARKSAKPSAFRSSKRRPNCLNWLRSSSFARSIMTCIPFHRTPTDVLVEIVSLNKKSNLLWKYINKYRHPKREDEAALFLGYGEPLHIDGISGIIKRIKKSCGFEGVRLSPHVFRHTFAKIYMEQGGDVLSLSREMGHSDIQVTRIYLEDFSSSDAKRHHKPYSPVNTINLSKRNKYGGRRQKSKKKFDG